MTQRANMKFFAILSTMVFAALVVAGPLQDNSDKEGQIEKRQRSVEDTYVDGEGMWVALNTSMCGTHLINRYRRNHFE
ncbi:hypothetical protein VI817_003598 [Penicillium citrinum]|nr:hypothetical protein VI817_003598 [Penicillium citrinum]